MIAVGTVSFPLGMKKDRWKKLYSKRNCLNISDLEYEMIKNDLIEELQQSGLYLLL